VAPRDKSTAKAGHPQAKRKTDSQRPGKLAVAFFPFIYISPSLGLSITSVCHSLLAAFLAREHSRVEGIGTSQLQRVIQPERLAPFQQQTDYPVSSVFGWLLMAVPWIT
jgi:hypothetical protein